MPAQYWWYPLTVVKSLQITDDISLQYWISSAHVPEGDDEQKVAFFCCLGVRFFSTYFFKISQISFVICFISLLNPLFSKSFFSWKNCLLCFSNISPKSKSLMNLWIATLINLRILSITSIFVIGSLLWHRLLYHFSKLNWFEIISEHSWPVSVMSLMYSAMALPRKLEGKESLDYARTFFN